jgi:hypothetical protein
MSKNGRVLKHRQFKHWSCIIRVNKTNIIVFCASTSKVEIFNFDLVLIREFSLETLSILNKYQDFQLNNYEIGFIGFDYFSYKAKLTCYDYRRLNSITKMEFSIGVSIILEKYKQHIECDQLVDLEMRDFNENFVFISTKLAFIPVILFLFDRTSAQCLFKYEWNDLIADLFVYNCAEVCFMDKNNKMYVYKVMEYRNECKTVEVNEPNFLNLYLTSFNKHIRGKDIIQKNEFILVNEY